MNIEAANPFNAKEAQQITLRLVGSNKIISTNGSGISCPVGENGEFIIQNGDVSDSVGSLEVKGYGDDSAGIGLSKVVGGECKGSIIVEGGNINAIGHNYGAGIGQMAYCKGGKIIIKDGIIEAQGGFRGTGIGGGMSGGNISIIIEGGHIKAKAGYCAAGIGNAERSESSTISISGGYIEAFGGGNASGIGGGWHDQGGIITISGGNISATGGEPSSGIGAGNNAKGQNITISGGVINAVGKNGGAGIGNSVTVGETESIFSTGNNGKAIIFATRISGQSNKELWSGMIFENKEGKIYGADTYEVNQDVTIPEGQTLIIEEGKSLSIAEDKTLTNKGTIVNFNTISNNGTLTNNGTIINVRYGEEENEVGSISTGTVNVNQPITQSKLTSQMISINPSDFVYRGSAWTPGISIENHSNYTYREYKLTYSDNVNAGTASVKVKMILSSVNGNNGLYGEAIQTFTIRKAVPTISFSGIPESPIYDGAEKTVTASITGKGSDILQISTFQYQQKNDGEEWLIMNDAPKNAGTYRAVATFAETSNYNELTQYSEAFGITKAPTAIAEITVPEKTYDGLAIAITPPTVTGGTLSDKQATLSYFQEATSLESAPINAGNYTVKAVYDGDENHEAATVVTKEFTIAKATPTITLTVPTEDVLVYDGEPKTATATMAGVNEEVLTATLSYEKKTGEDTWDALQDENKPTDVGAYRVTAKFDGNTNYNPAESQIETYTITPADAELTFAQTGLTMTKGNAVPANALTNPHTCAVTYTSSETTVATVNAETGEVTVVGVGTTTITATAQGNYAGEASYTLKVNRYIPPYYPPSDPVYYTVTIPTEVTGAIIHGGGAHEVEEYTYYTFRIELDPNGNGEYPTVTKGYWWDTLTPDGQGNYRVYVTGNTQITIGEVPTDSYLYYQVTLPTDSVTEAENQYWSGDYIEVIGATPLRAAEEASISYQAPFGATVTLRPIETERRKFLMWEDGSTQKERTLTLRADQEIKALWKRISPTGIEAIADGSVIRGERGQLYIEVPEPCDVTLYTYGGVPVRVARLAAGANRLANLNAGLYLVKIGAAPAVPVRIR